jgi:ABC-2 type transport system ATP-binding protein
MYTDEAVAEIGPVFGVSGETLVAVTDLTKRYARRVVVHKLSLRLRAGDVIGLVGSNGSGKTTTLRMLAGILKPDEGHGQILGSTW